MNSSALEDDFWQVNYLIFLKVTNMNYLILYFIWPVTGLLAALGNGFVMFVIYRYNRLHHPRFYFLFNLACADFISGITLVLLSVTRALNRETYTVVLYSVGVFTILVSVANILLISLDRLFAILKPFRYVKKMTTSTSFKLIACTWIVGLLLVVFEYTIPDTLLYTCPKSNIQDIRLNFLFPVITVYGMIVIVTVVHMKIFMIARRISLSMTSKAVSSARRTELRAAKTTSFIVCGFAVCFTPLVAYHNLICFCVPLSLDSIAAFSTILSLTASCNCALNPIIYSFRKDDIRKCILRALKKFKVCKL
ncbi:trace amine-associated receptor 7d-like [Antedon mediterranea]|uniref:trace amine-associated receptor 7d-like n=1 Tax=Antedon mediterranea TaxID=105859 RepID=UPI003AFA00E3